MTNNKLFYIAGAIAIITSLVLVVLNITNGRRHHKRKNGAGQQDIETDFILDTIEDGVVLVGDDGTIQLFNPAASIITGWTPTEAIGLDYKLVLVLVDEKGQPIDQTKHPFTQAINTHTTVKDDNHSLVNKTNRMVCTLYKEHQQMNELFENHVEKKLKSIYQDV